MMSQAEFLWEWSSVFLSVVEDKLVELCEDSRPWSCDKDEDWSAGALGLVRKIRSLRHASRLKCASEEYHSALAPNSEILRVVAGNCIDCLSKGVDVELYLILLLSGNNWLLPLLQHINSRGHYLLIPPWVVPNGGSRTPWTPPLDISG